MNTKHIFAAISVATALTIITPAYAGGLGGGLWRWIWRRSFRDVRHEPRSVRSRRLSGSGGRRWVA